MVKLFSMKTVGLQILSLAEESTQIDKCFSYFLTKTYVVYHLNFFLFYMLNSECGPPMWDGNLK